MIGKTVQGYEILEMRDAGAMGVVYKAKDPNLPRVVAIKLMNRALVEDETFLERFRLEARALAMVQSPNIVTIHQLIDTPDALAIVMEYVDGMSLQELATSQSLPWQRSARLIRQVLAGLGKAHDAGVIHRDIKPSNVLVLDDDTVKIVDFGLAKAEQSGRNLTQTGASAGTLYYMSPEQIHGFRNVDGRSDLYSVGVTFYKLVCGRLPFDTTGSNYEVLKEIVEGVFPPADQFNPLLPEPLVRFLSVSMAKKPSDRFSSAGEMIRVLDAILADSQIPATAWPDRASRPNGPQPVTESRVSHGRTGEETILSDPSRRSDSLERDISLRTRIGVEASAADAGSAPPVGSGSASEHSAGLFRRRYFLIGGIAALSAIAIALLVFGSSFFGPSPSVARLDITTHPIGARIFIDDQEVGLSPVPGLSQTSGVVHLKAILSGYAERESTLHVSAGESYQITLGLERPPTKEEQLPPDEITATESGSVTVTEERTEVSMSIQPWGQVWIDGVQVGGGEVRSESFSVEPGSRRVRVRHPELGTWERRIEVERGGSLQVQIDFTREVPVVVTSQGADGSYLMGEIIVDGRNTGATTPKEIQLRIGEHSIEVRRPGFDGPAVKIGVYGPIEDPIKVVLQPQ